MSWVSLKTLNSLQLVPPPCRYPIGKFFGRTRGRPFSSSEQRLVDYAKSVHSYEETVEETISMLKRLQQPLNNLQEVLRESHQHGARELLILNHLIQPLNAIEEEIINRSIEKLNHDSKLIENCQPVLHLLNDIKQSIPVVVKDIYSRQELLESLRGILKPLKNIEERMKILENETEGTLERDVAKILVNPLEYLLEAISVTSRELQFLDQRREIVIEIRNLVEPLVEFLSCLSVVQSSRKSLVPEAALLDERRNVILKAVEDLQRQTTTILERIPNLEGASLFERPLISLKNATASVQKQIGKTDYSRRLSSVDFTLQYNLACSFDHLRSTISTVEENADEPVRQVISKSLEALQKQITLSQTHFIQTSEQPVDEEAVVEGFLYPTNQLQSALNVLKEQIDQKTIASVSIESVRLLQVKDMGSENILQLTMAILYPMAVSAAAEASVSIKRLEKFLSLKENSNVINSHQTNGNGSIIMKNITASWTDSAIVNTLHDVNVQIEAGSFMLLSVQLVQERVPSFN